MVVKVLIYIEMLFIFSTLVFIRHLWQLKTVVFLVLVSNTNCSFRINFLAKAEFLDEDGFLAKAKILYEKMSFLIIIFLPKLCHLVHSTLGDLLNHNNAFVCAPHSH